MTAETPLDERETTTFRLRLLRRRAQELTGRLYLLRDRRAAQNLDLRARLLVHGLANDWGDLNAAESEARLRRGISEVEQLEAEWLSGIEDSLPRY